MEIFINQGEPTKEWRDILVRGDQTLNNAIYLMTGDTDLGNK